jgi:hypothetical protein
LIGVGVLVGIVAGTVVGLVVWMVIELVVGVVVSTVPPVISTHPDRDNENMDKIITKITIVVFQLNLLISHRLLVGYIN